MIVKFTLSIGYYGANREEEIEIDDEYIQGLTEDELQDYLLEYLKEWSDEYIDTGFEILDDA